MKRIIISLTVALVASLCGAQTLKRYPVGSYVCLPGSDPAIETEACWTNPDIRGVLLRAVWSNVEQTTGVYDWSYFDKGLQLCQQYGKKAQLCLIAGWRSPNWIYSLGSKRFALACGKTMPAPWDPVFEENFKRMVTAFGARYDSNQNVLSVTIWAGGKVVECFFATAPADCAQLDAAGGPMVWAAAAESFIDTYVAAFPTTQMFLATGQCYANDDGQTMTEVANYAITKGLGLETDALGENYPVATNSEFPHTRTDWNTVGVANAQLVLSLTSPRMAGQTTWQIASNALNCGFSAIQWYPTDPAQGPYGIRYFDQNAEESNLAFLWLVSGTVKCNSDQSTHGSGVMCEVSRRPKVSGQPTVHGSRLRYD
jgi:hypothetical protein